MMPAPWDELAGAVTAGMTAGGVAGNVYSTLSSKLSAPGVLIRPDEPWIEPASFEHYRERYLAVCFASAATPAAAIAKLRELVDVCLGALEVGESWAFDRVSAPRLDDSTGVTYLASAISITVRRQIPQED